jgi:hypothetical protein
LDTHQEVENIARAFYEAQDSSRPWDCELTIIKESFRLYARDALLLLREYQQSMLAEVRDTRFADVM